MLESILQAAELRELLQQIEGDLGLRDLSRVERDLIYAMRLIAPGGGHVATAELRAHPLMADLTQATFHRAIRELIACGKLRRDGGERARYLLTETIRPM